MVWLCRGAKFLDGVVILDGVASHLHSESNVFFDPSVEAKVPVSISRRNRKLA